MARSKSNLPLFLTAKLSPFIKGHTCMANAWFLEDILQCPSITDPKSINTAPPSSFNIMLPETINYYYCKWGGGGVAAFVNDISRGGSLLYKCQPHHGLFDNRVIRA